MKTSKTNRRYLALETSSPRLSLALGDESNVRATYTGPNEWRHAESLFEGMEKLLSEVRWPLQSLNGVAVSIGPGSFTGIRIGLAAARALGQALQIPVVGISSLEIMAHAACCHSRGSGNPANPIDPRFRGDDKERLGRPSQYFCPRIDALRGQLFSALYRRTRGGMQTVFSETMAPADRWMKKVQARAGRHPLWISPLKGCYPDAKVLLDLARPKLAEAGPKSYASVLPLYIRRAAAQERRARVIGRRT